MIEVAALLLCDRAVRDEQTGKWTLEGVFDVVWAERFPAIHATLVAYVRLRRHADAHHQPDDTPQRITLALCSPTGATHEAVGPALTFGAQGVAEALVRFERIPLHGPGDYRFEVRVDGRAIAHTVLTVAQSRAPSDELH